MTETISRFSQICERA